MLFSAGVSIAAPVSIVRPEKGNTNFITVVPNNPTGVTFQWFRGDTAIRRIDQYHDVDTDSLRIVRADNSFNGEYRVQLSRGDPYFCTSDSPTVTLSAREYTFT